MSLHLNRDIPFLVFRHHPDETPLKNGKQGGREVISKDVAGIVRDSMYYRAEFVHTHSHLRSRVSVRSYTTPGRRYALLEAFWKAVDSRARVPQHIPVKEGV